MLSLLSGFTQLVSGTTYYYTTTSSSDDPAALGFSFVLLCCQLIFVLALYVFLSYCISRIAKKTGHADKAIWAWIPVLNIILLLEIADMPLWFVILYFIPFVNIVVGLIVWMKVAEKCGKESWWGLLLLIPIVNFVVIYMLGSD